MPISLDNSNFMGNKNKFELGFLRVIPIPQIQLKTFQEARKKFILSRFSSYCDLTCILFTVE